MLYVKPTLYVKPMKNKIIKMQIFITDYHVILNIESQLITHVLPANIAKLV